MEHIVGERIDAYVERLGLPLAERLRLFLRVCDAVRLAHQNLVVHRDLKPGNILVTAEGEPKLLDFGIAKLLDPVSAGEAAGEAAETRRGENPLTPRYASPEQVRGEGITTGSDIYSLGVILYELVAGRGPYTVPLTSAAALVQAICETQPAPPSAVRLEATGRRCTASGRTSTNRLKALRKDPADRYAREALARDVHASSTSSRLRRRGSRSYRPGALRPPSAVVARGGAVLSLHLAGFVVSPSTSAARDRAPNGRDTPRGSPTSGHGNGPTHETRTQLLLFSAADPRRRRARDPRGAPWSTAAPAID